MEVSMLIRIKRLIKMDIKSLIKTQNEIIN